MNSFWLAFSTVCPLLLLMSLGMLLKKSSVFNEDFLTRLNALCFKIFIPAAVFQNVYTSSFASSVQIDVLLFATGGIVVAYVILAVIVPRFEKHSNRCGVLIQGGFRSNIVLFGLPVSNTLFGSEHAGGVSVLIAFMVPLFNVLAVMAFESNREGKDQWGRAALGIAKNPLVLAGVIGIAFSATGVHFPGVIETAVQDVSQVATPLALIALGGSFSFGCVWKNREPLFWTVVCKLVLLPAAALAIAVAFGYRGVELGSLLALFATPAAVSTFPMAQQLGGDGELAGQIVAVGSAMSIATLFAFIAILDAFGMFVV